ncbi:hypothetical protein KUV80_16685 [Fictibacillus nanhaiensis]|uniref:hypothetical protein n=1 Tax=Fictibacillus nanhaiensis TaxID=742169 RepID=UPI001C98857F|nr:hypothetical protein [Fictibacillus nanhaiensis]MBY6038285.1 hypothetical protein [Fictibacillus nanhaiensis]
MAKMYKLSSRTAEKKSSLYVSRDPELAGSVVRNEESEFAYSEVFMDNQKNYWFSKKVENHSKEYKLFIFDHKNGCLKSQVIKGQPNFYEFDSCVVVACEGDGSKGSVLIFSKNGPELLKEWKVNGYLWEVEMHNEVLYISSYIVEEDQAVLYIIRNGKKKRVNLGSNMAPTDILCVDNLVYVSGAPVLNGDPKKVMVLNEKDKVFKEYKLSISPRALYQVNGDLLVYELDLSTGKSERIVYINIETGEQKEHEIPHSKIVECTNDSLSLFEQNSKTLYIWDHCNRRIINTQKATEHHKVI